LSCAASSCLVLSCLVLLRLVAFCRAWSCPVLPCLASLCPGFFLPGLVWSYFLKSANKKLSVTTAFFQKSCQGLFVLKLKFVKNSFAKRLLITFLLLKQVSSKVLPSLALPCHDSPCPALSCSSCLVWRSGLYRGWLRQLLFWMLAVCVLHAPCCQLVSLSLGQLKRRATDRNINRRAICNRRCFWKVQGGRTQVCDFRTYQDSRLLYCIYDIVWLLFHRSGATVFKTTSCRGNWVSCRNTATFLWVPLKGAPNLARALPPTPFFDFSPFEV
jgi:hypothetical protein